MSKNLRYFILTAIFALCLLLEPNHTSAQDVYMGNNEDGLSLYVMTETIEANRLNGAFTGFSVRVKYTAGSNFIKAKGWVFSNFSNNGGWHYHRSDMGRSSALVSENEVAQSIFDYCIAYLGED